MAQGEAAKKAPFPTRRRLRQTGASPHTMSRAPIGGHVAFTKENFGERLFESVGRSYRDLPATLEALASALVLHGRLHSLTMQVDDIGTLSVERQEPGTVSRWEAPSLLPRKMPAQTNTERNAGWQSEAAFTHGILYAGRTLGQMQSWASGPCDAASPMPDLLAQFARQCGRLVMRDRLESWSLGRLGQPLRLIGLSPAMRELDRFVEAASASPLPVLLQGEFGTEKLAAAAAIHCCGPQADKPFFAVDCSDPDSDPCEWLDRAKGGTLFLSAIDRLSRPLQSAVPRHLPSRLALWPHTGLQRAPRIIASTTLDLPQLVADGHFSRQLAIELCVLEVRLPPLRERKSDLGAVARDTVARLGYDADRKVSDALVEACLAYDWPENQAELERLLGRLATLTGTAPIDAAAIRRHAPALALEEESADPRPIAVWTPPTATPLDRWALRAIDPLDSFPELDPALAKALSHLGERFEESIVLADLAAVGGVGPSRMSALFRSVIGVSFKKLLRQIRILVACEQLAREPTISITLLAFEIGFGDLSYFERSFRSAIGESPRQFRERRRLGQQGSPGSVLSDSVRNLSVDHHGPPHAD